MIETTERISRTSLLRQLPPPDLIADYPLSGAPIKAIRTVSKRDYMPCTPIRLRPPTLRLRVADGPSTFERVITGSG